MPGTIIPASAPPSITAAFIALAVGIGPSAQADLSQATTTSPGGFIQAGAYPSTNGGGGAPGQDLVVNYGTGQSFQEFAFAGVSSAAATASASGPGQFGTVTNSASGSAQMGRARMMAYNSSPLGTMFSAGLANGGWKETFTVSHPSLNGQAGFMVFQVRARGTLTVTGTFNDLSGAASLTIAPYKDNIYLMQSASWSLGNAISFATRTVDETVTMTVPITFGQSFTLGVYARAAAGQGSQAFGQPQSFYSSATTDFSGGGVTWEGIASVQSGGQPVSGYTVISATGMNWSQPFGACPCPADFNCSGAATVQDIFDFLGAYFNNDPRADFNQSGAISVQDVFDFLAAYFAGCA